MIFISLSPILVRKEYLAKMSNQSKRHGAGPSEARGPMQPHRLHRLKAGRCVCNPTVLSSTQLQKVCNSVTPPAPMPCETFCFVCFY